MAHPIYSGLNGNVSVSIFSDGTKIRSYEGDPRPDYPESVDIKITDYCDAGCAFCHEDSTVRGKHADHDFLLDYVLKYPRGTELAIGGGNPLAYPKIVNLLMHCKDAGLIANMTINEVHVDRYRDLIEAMVGDGFIKGVGISGVKRHDWLYELTDNVVHHVITGVHDIDLVKDLPKVLVLGYKMFRRGEGYFDKHGPVVDRRKREWFNRVNELFGRTKVSFDNLAIDQLRLRRFFSDAEWEKFFMGADGTHTCYIDMVNQCYAVSSTSDMRYSLTNPLDDFRCVLTTSTTGD